MVRVNGGRVSDLTVSPSGASVYALTEAEDNFGTNYLRVIDTVTLKTLASVALY
jgi:hypothetical protein